MNGNIKIKNLKRSKKSGELEGSIITTSSKLKPIKISKDIAKFIDEIPILAVCAVFANGVSKFDHVQQLANKESNRILEIKKLLNQAGIKCKTTKDSIKIYGKNKIETKNKSIVIKTKGDHRICMSATILALVTGIKTKIENFETVNTSFPGFVSILRNLGGKIVYK
jgi:3-phosphoshikimate 1-carboxyvinyltransferase